MIRKYTLLLLLCCFVQNNLFAQACATDRVQRKLAQQNPAAYAQKIALSTQRWIAHNNNQANFLFDNGQKKVYQIPIAIHVITTGGAVGTIYNPTDSQLLSIVDYLNQVYNGTWPGYPDSVNGGVSIPLQYVLAKRDSACNPTNGIDRVDGSGVPGYTDGGINTVSGSGIGADEVAVKNLDRWPLNEYYNVWVVNKIDGQDGTVPGQEFTAGFAYLAQATDPAHDGIVMLATQTTQGDITFPHELGHAMSLLHTFEGNDPDGTGANNCPVNNNCLTDGDQICDTQPEMQSNFDCPVDPNPCTGVSYDFVQHNFMDYSDCQDRFTAGQRARVIWGLMTYRQVLLGSAGVLSPDTLVAATTCIPTVSNPSNTFNAGPQEVKISDTYTSSYIGAAYSYLDYPTGGYNDDGNVAYQDYTCKQQANLAAGTAYKFFVKAGQSGIGEKVRIYIDFNNDGVFSPAAGELIYSHDGTVANELDSTVYTIPTTATMPSMHVNQPLRMRVISDMASVATVDSCGTLGYGQAEDYALYIVGQPLPAADTATVSLTTGDDTSCVGTSLTFTVTPNTGAVSPTYQWFINGVATGITTTTITTDTLSSGDYVSCDLYYFSDGNPDTAHSNIITIYHAAQIPAHVTVALTDGNNPGCPQSVLTFTALPYNGGTAPQYQWKVNGNPVNGATNATYTSTFNQNDVVTVFMTSNSPCAPVDTVTSNAISIFQVQYTTTLSITATPTPACSGRPVTFNAQVTNLGGNDIVKWYLNGVVIPGATDLTYIADSMHQGDAVYCTISTTDPCITNQQVTSNTITITVNSSLTPSISDSMIQGSNPGCIDSMVVFSGSANNFGSSPLFTWLVNNVPTATGTIFSTTSLHNGDGVVLRVTATDGNCYTADTLFTAPIFMSLDTTPNPPLVSLIGDQLVTNITGGTFTWYGPNGLIPGATGQTYHPTELGPYYVTVENNGCVSPKSNTIVINILSVGDYNISQVKIYPNPTRGKVQFDWNNQQTNMHIDVYSMLGQGLLHEEVNGQTSKTLDLSAFASGNYFVMLRDKDGRTAVVKITLTK